MAVTPTPPRRTLLRPLGAVGTFVLSAAMVLTCATVAQASPTASELKAEIAAQNKALEPVIEHYNGLRAKLASDKAKAKKLEKTLGSTQLQATVAQGRLGDIASTFYQTGPVNSVEALFATNSTNDMIEVLGALDELARQQASQINDATKLVTDYKAQQSELTKLIAEEKQQYATLVKQKAKIQSQVDHLQKLLDEANAAAAAAAAASSGSSSTSSSSGGTTYTKSQLMPVACPYTSTSGKGHTAAVKACSLVWDTSHSPPWRMYGWADAGPDKYDCSGLTMAAWKAAGVTLTHYTGDQWNESYAISESQLRPGDLVFYFTSHSHVALYVGGGWIVQAEETGQPLKMSRMTFTSPRYYRRVNGT